MYHCSAVVCDNQSDRKVVSEKDGVTAVSYTHLDVYKRQGLLQQKYSLPSVSPSVIPERGLRLPLDRTRSVSYTHLDVYKRQLL